jgi:hypothetical protein
MAAEYYSGVAASRVTAQPVVAAFGIALTSLRARIILISIAFLPVGKETGK